jgi:pyruvate,water dikinase
MGLAINLNSVSKEIVGKIGGKGSNLAKLIEYNFNVPEGYCIITDAYTRFIKENNLDTIIKNALNKVKDSEYQSLEKIAEKIQTAIKKSTIPREILAEIEKICKSLSCDSYVVRSSATAEDLESASFAGQYDSYLNLKNMEDIVSHIKECYASLWTTRALSYRLKNDIPYESAQIAVIIQKMIPAKAAGVLFTKNPLSTETTEMLIESNFGLGESVVGGISSPDQFTLKQKQKKSTSFEILNKKIGRKQYIIQPTDGDNECGTQKVQLSEDKWSEPSLTDTNILKLAEIGINIEQAFESPQDIEWAIDESNHIVVLQSRPITAMKAVPSALIGSDILFSRGYSDDYWNDNVTPLFFDLLGDQLTKVVNIHLNSIMGYKRMHAKLLKLHHGHVYFNLNVLKRKVENEIPTFVRNEDVLNYFPKGAGPFGKKTIKDLPFHLINRIVAELRVRIFDPNGSMTKTDKVYEEWTKEEFNSFCDFFDAQLKELDKKGDAKSLFELATSLDEKMVEHFELVRYGIPVHNIGMNLMVQYLLKRFIGKQDAIKYYPILISGLNHKLTETNEQLHKLALSAQKNEKLKFIILNTESKNLYQQLLDEEDPEIKSFIERFNKFIKEQGDRGFTREPYYPRWSDAPEYVFDIIQSLLTEKEQKLNKIKAKNEKFKKLIERRVEQKIRSQFLGYLKWKLLSIILNFSRRYIIFRENQRYNLDKWIARNRKVFMKIGHIFQQKGMIEKAIDIFFLRKREIKEIIENRASSGQIVNLKSIISERKKEFFEYENILPPKFIIGDREYNDTLDFKESTKIFQGIAASQGLATGRIRVLNKIEDIPQVNANEILVVPRTDPGWTPVFSKIGGLITETGGILSHGAVVSREYGIPAVTNIPNACKLFKTGQMVQINGYDGQIRIK